MSASLPGAGWTPQVSSPTTALHTADGCWSLSTLFAQTCGPTKPRESRKAELKRLAAEEKRRADAAERFEAWLWSHDADREDTMGRIV
jgi:aminoglycoside phosphotransferase (APT) family kinase protein